jgi:16S rRNA processing protein RimM
LSNSSIPPEDLLLIGKIVGVHGVRGNVKVISYAETQDVFETDRPFLVLDTRGISRMLTVDWVKPYKQGLLMALQDIHDRQGAEEILQAEIYIRKSDLPVLEADTYYWFDLIGLSVFETNGNRLGRIESVIPTGSNDVYVVKDKDRGAAYEVLIPGIASVVRTVDLEGGVMAVELPEGL